MSRSATRHDAVVVGAGIAGLSAACLLAAAGKRVALVEAADEVGGLCRTVRAGGLAWDLALYGLRGGARGGPLCALFEELGIAARVPLRRAERSYVVDIAGERFPLTTVREEMLEAAGRLARGGAGRLGALLERVLAFSPVRDYGALSRASFAELAHACGVEGRLLAAFAAPLMVSLGLPPERASAYFAALKYQLLLGGGVSVPEGGAARLVGALRERYLEAGGALFTGERVGAVAVRADGAKHVETAHRSFVGEALVLAVDATRALAWLAPLLPARLAAAPRSLIPALSATVLLCDAPPAALAAAGLGRAPQAIVVRDEDFGALHRALREGREPAAAGILGMTSPAAWLPPGDLGARVPLSVFFLAPPAGHGTGGADPSALLARLRHCVPGLPQGIAAVAAVGPGEFAALSGSASGAFSGWELGPERYGPARIPAKLPLPGVWLAGHWTEPGPSVLNAALSGRTAARGILGSVAAR